MATLTTTQPDAIANLWRAFDDYKRATDARIATLEQQIVYARLLPGDATLATTLLPALAVALGEESFLSDFLSDTRDPNLRFIIGRRSTKSVGGFLRRIEGLAFNGWMIVGDGKLHNRRQWRVRRVVTDCLRLGGPA
jgi:hypothetical protein